MKYVTGDKVCADRYLYLYTRPEKMPDAGVEAGTVLTVEGFDKKSSEPRACSYRLRTDAGELIIAPAKALYPVYKSSTTPRDVVLYNEAKGCLYRVNLITETEKSYFAGHDGNECAYLKSNWVILEGGLDIVQMMNVTGKCIRIEDAITLYKAGFRRMKV